MRRSSPCFANPQPHGAQAKRLLAHSTLAVSAIGLELGFSEPTNFVKFFRHCEGLTPAAFREGTASA